MPDHGWELDRQYADPDHAPQWRARSDRPLWASNDVRYPAMLRAYVSRRLCELAALVRAERIAAIEAEITPDDLAAMLRGVEVGTGPRVAERIAMMRRMKPSASFNELARMEKRWDEEKANGGQRRRGPTKTDPAERARLPAALAARDMWRIRKVIFPRFWPEEAAGGWRRDKLEVARIAAHRHSCTPAEADSWYENNRLASK